MSVSIRHMLCVNYLFESGYVVIRIPWSIEFLDLLLKSRWSDSSHVLIFMLVPSSYVPPPSWAVYLRECWCMSEWLHNSLMTLNSPINISSLPWDWNLVPSLCSPRWRTWCSCWASRRRFEGHFLSLISFSFISLPIWIWNYGLPIIRYFLWSSCRSRGEESTK